MQQETAQQSHIGHRQDNQDRVEIIQGSGASLLIVVDGMGGHTGGALAAQAAVKTIGTAFKDYEHPILDPHGFLISAIASAHDAVVNLGEDQALDARPRATCALCLVQDGGAFWHTSATVEFTCSVAVESRNEAVTIATWSYCSKKG